MIQRRQINRLLSKLRNFLATKISGKFLSLILKDNQYCGYVFNNLNSDFRFQISGFYQEAIVYNQIEASLDYQGLNYLEERFKS